MGDTSRMSSMLRTHVLAAHKSVLASCTIWGFPKVRGALIGVPHNKDYSKLGSILGSPYKGNYHF